ncbi:MAG: FMN-dependent NADH-azoreductase [Gammaproteobacteria bacterium]|nr:FMN-dependent NADH-azoreductase [Gammaproteobacteria bacterium]
MTTLLHIDSSARTAASVTRELSALLVEGLGAAQPGLRVLRRDLGIEAPPAIDATQAEALFVGDAERSAAQAASLALSDTLVDELLTADILVAGMPMYNFTVPASFKAWIDLVVRPRRTFRRVGPGQFEGLCTGKRAVFCTACSGAWNGGASDHLRPYLRTVMALMGIESVDFIDAEKLARGDEARAASLAGAHGHIDQLVTELSG